MGRTHDAVVVSGWEHLSRDAWAALLFGVTALLLHAAATELTRRIRRQHAPDDEPRADSVTARPR